MALPPLSRTTAAGGERSEPGEGSVPAEFSPAEVRAWRTGCLPVKGGEGLLSWLKMS